MSIREILVANLIVKYSEFRDNDWTATDGNDATETFVDIELIEDGDAADETMIAMGFVGDIIFRDPIPLALAFALFQARRIWPFIGFTAVVIDVVARVDGLRGQILVCVPTVTNILFSRVYRRAGWSEYQILIRASWGGF
jgi:hypothetical protein